MMSYADYSNNLDRRTQINTKMELAIEEFKGKITEQMSAELYTYFGHEDTETSRRRGSFDTHRQEASQADVTLDASRQDWRFKEAGPATSKIFRFYSTNKRTE